jgi:hypothetical protein
VSYRVWHIGRGWIGRGYACKPLNLLEDSPRYIYIYWTNDYKAESVRTYSTKSNATRALKNVLRKQGMMLLK